MQFPSHLEIQEDINSQIPQLPVKLTVKPTGDFKVEGHPDHDLIERLLTSSDYHISLNRQESLEIEKYRLDIQKQIQMDAQRTDTIIISFLGLTFIVIIIAAFLSINRTQEHQNVRQHTPGTCTYR